MNVRKIGIAQYASAHLNLDRSIAIMKSVIAEAASEKLNMLVFGETWLSGYPSWLDHCPEVAQWDHQATKEAYLQLRKSAITIPGKETELIGRLAKKAKMTIVIGVNEKVLKGVSNGTIFNTLLTFNENGDLVNHHRKLMPTYTEKMLYGQGDGYGLKSVDTNCGKVTGLICWEHWMPLTRQALHNAGEDIHVAVWPTVHERHQIASRQYAFEGRCFVLAAGQILKASDFPKNLKLPDYLQSDKNQLTLTGGSCIINPRGDYVIEPVFDQEKLITGEIDLDEKIKEQMTLDVSGHYQRPDVFQLTINKERQT